MHRITFQWALTTVATLTDLAVFIHYFPLACEAWGTDRRFMVTMAAVLFDWAGSLANLWDTAWRSLRNNSSIAISSFVELTTVVPEVDRGV